MTGDRLPPIAGARKRRVLLITTRDPRGPMSGRIMVLRTILRSLSTLGHDVTVAGFGLADAARAPAHPDNAVAAWHPLPHAGRFERAVSLARALLSGRVSLNEALYSSRQARRVIADLVASGAFDVVVTDMIRTASYGRDSGLPWIADLDDLLSDRYVRMAADEAAPPISFGYLEAPVLSRLAAGFNRLGRWVLRREAGVLRLRERAIARQAHLVTLVSSAEAEALTRASGIQVVATPMAIPAPPEPITRSDRPGELVFLGGLDYAGNFQALREFDTQVRPRLAALGLGEITLDVIGTAPQVLRSHFSSAIRFQGYVDNLYTVLQGYRFMVVPPVTPGGIKTKIGVAARAGTVVLAHVTATEGMELTHGKDVLVWSSAEELATLIRALRAQEIDASGIAHGAREWVEALFGESRLQELWRRNLDLCLQRAGR